MFDYEAFTEKARKILMDIQDILSRYKQNQMGSEHILLALLEDRDNLAVEVLAGLGVDLDSLKKDTENIISRYSSSGTTGGQIYMTPDARHVLENAKAQAGRMQDSKIGTEHLLLAIVNETSAAASKLLMKFGIDVEKLYSNILNRRSSGEARESENIDMLKRFTIDLTDLAERGKLMPVIGREEEIRRVIQIIGRKTKNNPALVGEPGVGKTAIVEGLAQRIVTGDIPEYLRGKKVLALDMGRVVAGTKFRGEFEERMKGIIDSVKKMAGEIILFVDEIHTVVGAGSAEGSMDAANLMKPALSRGELQCVGATTLDEYRKHIERDRALERRFQAVLVSEPTAGEALEILKGLRESYEKHHQIEITDEALETAVNLSVKYIADRYLPDKAIDLVDEAASYVRLRAGYMPDKLRSLEKELKETEQEISELAEEGDYEQAARVKTAYEKRNLGYRKRKEEWIKSSGHEECAVTKDIIADIVEQWTGIPAGRMLESERSKLMNMEELIHKRIVDQDDAVKTVAQTIRRARAGMKLPRKPWGAFLFMGPSGVGKTELAKTLAEILFGSEEALVRLDMSEYMEKHTTSRLIGAPPGYVGYEEGGQLTEAIRRRPYSVILLDEVEKAHSEVHNVLLQVMDDGRLTDGKGKTVSFSNTILIMTSNISSEELSEIDRDRAEAAESVERSLKATFKTEFINRLDAIVLFKPLGGDVMKKIVTLQFEDVKNRLSEQDITLEYTDHALELIASSGYDRLYGARPVRRIIERDVEGPIADMIISGDLQSGEAVILDSNEYGTSIKKKRA